jgi:quercetin dioxygenase-like cupin family protein
MNPVDVAEIRKDWTSRRFSCDVWIDPPGQTWEDFVHPVDELVLVLEGEVEFEIGGKVFHPRPGEELRIPALTRHSARNKGETVARWLFGYKI